ncbi:MAG: hypothetical protein EOO85_11455, partial [Pedobacter sp.]
MNREELIVLADRILNKEASEAEISAYNAWYNSFQESGEMPVINEADKKKILYARISSSIDSEVSVKRLSNGRFKIGIWAAAAAVAFLAIGIYFFNAPLNADKSKTADLAASTGSIKPGRNTAKLTLANGKSIDLSESKTGVVIDVAGLKYSDETAIAATQANDLKKDGLMSIAT